MPIITSQLHPVHRMLISGKLRPSSPMSAGDRIAEVVVVLLLIIRAMNCKCKQCMQMCSGLQDSDRRVSLRYTVQNVFLHATSVNCHCIDLRLLAQRRS
jgi:hypothetical protein